MSFGLRMLPYGRLCSLSCWSESGNNYAARSNRHKLMTLKKVWSKNVFYFIRPLGYCVPFIKRKYNFLCTSVNVILSTGIVYSGALYTCFHPKDQLSLACFYW